MSTMKEIRDRIKSVTNTGQITKAMRMVAASNLRRVQTVMEPSKRFAKMNEHIIESLVEGSEIDNIYLKEGKGDIVRYVMIVGNRGLCGIYNLAIVQFLKEIYESDDRKKELWVAGKWGGDVIAGSGFDDEIKTIELNDIPTAKESAAFAATLSDDFKNGKVKEVNIVYQSYISALKQEPVCRKLLPIDKNIKGKRDSDEADVAGFSDYDFEPDKEALLDIVISQYIENKVLSILQEAKCGEHTARMTAMTNANENIDELVSKLQISYNRARQEAITNEISEIVGGAAALKR